MIEGIEPLCTSKMVYEHLRMSKSNWYKLVKEGKAPQPVEFSDRGDRWRHSDIKEYMADPKGYAEKLKIKNQKETQNAKHAS